MNVKEIDGKMIARFGNENAEKQGYIKTLEAHEALLRLEDNEDFKTLINFITETRSNAYTELLAYQVEERGQYFEEIVWRSQLKKELAGIKDTDTVAAREFIEG